jgi:hypothetical protein
MPFQKVFYFLAGSHLGADSHSLRRVPALVVGFDRLLAAALDSCWPISRRADGPRAPALVLEAGDCRGSSFGTHRPVYRELRGECVAISGISVHTALVAKAMLRRQGLIVAERGWPSS